MKNLSIKKSTKKAFAIIFTFLISFIILSFNIGTRAFAQADQPATTYLNELEEEILLNLPIVTENPNYSLTFKDPSPDAKGINLDLDGKGSSQISSPYALPTLGIGKHTLEFSFFDSEGAAQTLERDLYIIPRSPTINEAIFKDGILTINGQGLPSSDIEILVSGTARTLTIYTKTDDKGNWDITRSDITQESEIVITALCRKNGFSSYFAQELRIPLPAIIDIDDNTQEDENPDTTGINFTFSSINLNNIINIFKKNIDLLYYSVGVLLFGLLIGLIIGALDGKDKTNKSDKAIRSALNVNKGELTLKDKLSAVGANVKKLEADQTSMSIIDNATTNEITETAIKGDTQTVMSKESTDTVAVTENIETTTLKESIDKATVTENTDLSLSKENADSETSTDTVYTSEAPEVKATVGLDNVETIVEESDITNNIDAQTETTVSKSENVEKTSAEEVKIPEAQEPEKHKKSFMERLFGSSKKTEAAMEKEVEDLNTQLDGQAIEKDDFLMSFKDFDPDPENGAKRQDSEANSQTESQSTSITSTNQTDNATDSSEHTKESNTSTDMDENGNRDDNKKSYEINEDDNSKKEKGSSKKSKKKSSTKKSRNIKITLTSK